MIDTIQVARDLQKSGLPQGQAEAIAHALLELPESGTGLEKRIAKVEADLTLLRWMVGTNLVLTIAILARLFVK